MKMTKGRHTQGILRCKHIPEQVSNCLELRQVVLSSSSCRPPERAMSNKRAVRTAACARQRAAHAGFAKRSTLE